MTINDSGPLDAPHTSTLVHPPEIDPQWKARHAGGDIQDDVRLSVTFRHSGWHRERVLLAESLARTGQALSRQAAFRDCGSHAYVLQSVEDPNVCRIAGSSCHDRFCLPCARERSFAIASNVIDRIRDRNVRFLTLTIKSDHEPLTQQLDKLYAAFQTLRRRQFWKDHVTGGVAFLEVQWNEGPHRWHPHFHILIEGLYMPKQRIKSLWYEITRDSFVIDIRLVEDATKVGQYVTKYATKPFNNTFVNRPDRLDEAIVALAGRKLAVTFGAWRGIILARRPLEGQWTNIGTLEEIICHAAHGDRDSREILRRLADCDLHQLYARAPPPLSAITHPPALEQNGTFYDVWDSDRYWTIHS